MVLFPFRDAASPSVLPHGEAKGRGALEGAPSPDGAPFLFQKGLLVRVFYRSLLPGFYRTMQAPRASAREMPGWAVGFQPLPSAGRGLFRLPNRYS
jgi:hypothetical protein